MFLASMCSPMYVQPCGSVSGVAENARSRAQLRHIEAFHRRGDIAATGTAQIPNLCLLARAIYTKNRIHIRCHNSLLPVLYIDVIEEMWHFGDGKI